MFHREFWNEEEPSMVLFLDLVRPPGGKSLFFFWVLVTLGLTDSIAFSFSEDSESLTFFNGWCSIRVCADSFSVAASIVYNLLKSGLACSSLLNLFGFSTASSREFTSSTRLRGAVDINWNVSITVLELIRLPASDMVKLFNSLYLIALSRSNWSTFSCALLSHAPEF